MNIALILSGGVGTRLGGDIPKQYRVVGDAPIISYCLETLVNHEEIDAIQIVADPVWQDFVSESMNGSEWKQKMHGFSLPEPPAVDLEWVTGYLQLCWRRGCSVDP